MQSCSPSLKVISPAATPKKKARVYEVLYQVSVRLHRPQNKAKEIDEVEKSEKRIAWKGRKIAGYLTQDDTITSLGTALLKDFYEAPLPR